MKTFTRFNHILTIEYLGNDLANVQWGLWYPIGKQLWTKVYTKKPHYCSACGKTIPKCRYMYRPADNKMNRMKRICQECIEND